MAVKDYHELNVYQMAFSAAIDVHQLSESFPKVERYALTDQIRRSSRSVCANLAEAWRKRIYPNHFASKITDSEAEAAETIVWLDFAFHFQYLVEEKHIALVNQYEQICRQLAAMSARPEQWVPK